MRQESENIGTILPMNESVLTLTIVPPTSCDGCGACCRGIGSPVLLYASNPEYGVPHPFRPADLPPALIEEIDFHFSGLRRGQEPLEACLWYDWSTQSCKHYDFRPQICRDYELGGAECLRERRTVAMRMMSGSVSQATNLAAKDVRP